MILPMMDETDGEGALATGVSVGRLVPNFEGRAGSGVSSMSAIRV